MFGSFRQHPVRNHHTLADLNAAIKGFYDLGIVFTNAELLKFTYEGRKTQLSDISYDERSGFCVQINNHLYGILKARGFVVRRVKATFGDMIADGSHTDRRPADHMVLIVTIEDQQYIVDAGAGLESLRGALPVVLQTRLFLGPDKYMIEGSGDRDDGYRVHRIVDNTDDYWRPLFLFDHTDYKPNPNAEHEDPTDTVLDNLESINPHTGRPHHNSMHKYLKLCTFDKAMTRYGLVINRFTGKAHYSIEYSNGTFTHREINSVEEVKQLCAQTFGATFGPELEYYLWGDSILKKTMMTTYGLDDEKITGDFLTQLTTHHNTRLSNVEVTLPEEATDLDKEVLAHLFEEFTAPKYTLTHLRAAFLLMSLCSAWLITGGEVTLVTALLLYMTTAILRNQRDGNPASPNDHHVRFFLLGWAGFITFNTFTLLGSSSDALEELPTQPTDWLILLLSIAADIVRILIAAYARCFWEKAPDALSSPDITKAIQHRASELYLNPDKQTPIGGEAKRLFQINDASSTVFRTAMESETDQQADLREAFENTF